MWVGGWVGQDERTNYPRICIKGTLAHKLQTSMYDCQNEENLLHEVIQGPSNHKEMIAQTVGLLFRIKPSTVLRITLSCFCLHIRLLC